MAVEDGAVLGKLLGLASHQHANSTSEVLHLYERLRKTRTTANVKGATNNRKMYHLHDGEEQRQRDRELKEADWNERGRGSGNSTWKWVDVKYNADMLGFDAVGDCERAWRELGVENREGQKQRDGDWGQETLFQPSEMLSSSTRLEASATVA